MLNGDTTILLKATERNWDLIAPGDWEKRSWKIKTDGWYQYTEAYRSGSPDIPEIPALTEEGALTGEQMNQLKEYLQADWTDEAAETSDATAWEFKMYEDGELVKHREMGSVDGVEPYESIIALLLNEAR